MRSSNASTPTGRVAWRRNWLRCIAEFADLPLQQRSWPGGPGFESPYWSFAEFNCRYFHDQRLDDGYGDAVAGGLLTQAEADAVAALHAAVDRYKTPGGDDYGHAAILSDPQWQHVVHLADEARCALRAMLQDPTERAMLEREDVQGP